MTNQPIATQTSHTRPPKSKPQNPVDAAIAAWISDLPADLTDTQSQHVSSIVSGVPKRWVVYSPMVLLPAGNSASKWWSIAESSDAVMKSEQERLWTLMLKLIGKREGKGPLTHMAINSGIPFHNPTNPATNCSEPDEKTPGIENILRTPNGLVMLHGNFGPVLSPSHTPTSEDFDDTFWVSTKQNGITQIWAPRYTMFSRGNVKEKARLLDFHRSREFTTRGLDEEALSNSIAIDLYAGIGYFVFSYMKFGLKKVIGWELNPWSIEGLRRGALANGWTIKIVRQHEELQPGTENILVLAEDNQAALNRLQGLGSGYLKDIRHINCGLLPTSNLSWKMAFEIMICDGWLHLHENVGVEDVQTRKSDIETTFRVWMVERHDARVAKVEHVELVKTFAPGVWHCVFDVHIAYPQSG